MKFAIPDRLPFINDAVQGLAYWIGYQRSYYRHYKLTEGALVGELCSLIQAKISKEQALYPEVMFKNIIRTSENPELFGNQRADLVILDANSPDPYKTNASAAVQFIFEVKRSDASNALINSDLQRLYDFKKNCRKGARAFLIIVSEGSLPKRFVKPESGNSKRGEHKIPGRPGVYHVRRTAKAGASFKKIAAAHFVSICEVFDKPTKSPPSL